MCKLCAERAMPLPPLGRRNFLKFAAGAAAGLALCDPAAVAAAPKSQPKSQPKSPPKPQPKPPPKLENVLPPDAALDRLMKGNARYIAGFTQRVDFRHEREVLSGGQNPFAAILGCADSRIAPEFCFDTARGDVFVCRVAGNFATEEIIASFEYAVQVLNTPLIMVLGHEACGAVDATIKSVKDGTTLPGHLPSLVHALTSAVQAVEGKPGDLLVNAIRSNVAMTVDRLKTATPILKSFVDGGTLKVVGGLYHLATGKVELLA